MINSNLEIKILEQTYFDKVTVKRYKKVKDNDTGISKSIEVLLYENIPCAISRKDEPIANGEIASIISTQKMFINPKYDVLEGDRLYVTLFNGKERKYLASKPFYYPSYTSVPITEKERF